MMEKPYHMPLVSVGIPCYNRPEGLRKALESLLSQSYPNLELIISDNCSSNTDVKAIGMEFAEKDKRIVYSCHKENIGGPANFASLVSRVSGKYLLFNADDDYYSPTYIEECVGFLEKNTGYVCAYGEPYVNASGSVHKVHDSRRVSFESEKGVVRMLQTYYATSPRLAAFYGVIRTDILRRTKIPCRVAGDRFFLAAIAFQGKIRLLRGIGMIRGAGASSAQTAKQAHRQMQETNGLKFRGVLLTRLVMAFFAGIDVFKQPQVFNELPLWRKICLAICCFCVFFTDTLWCYYIRPVRNKLRRAML